MVMLLTGENSYEIAQTLAGLEADFDGRAERIDGSTLELKNIPDLLMGSTLFADKRLVIIKDLSQNSSVWEKLPDWLPRVSSDITLVLVDQKPDKRTSTYKTLKKEIDVKEFINWGQRDTFAVVEWVMKQAGTLDMKLDKKVAQLIVNRVGFDQWRLASALEKLSLIDEVTAETITETIDASPEENVFELFELALDGKRSKIHDVIRNLELTEEPYQLFALLSSQAFQLAAVASAKAGDDPAKDLAIHPYVVSKLTRHAKKLGPDKSLNIVKIFAQADADMKVSRADPWLLIEKSLLSIN